MNTTLFKVSRQDVLACLEKICKPIASTMGPGGRGIGVLAPVEIIYQHTRDLNKDGVIARENMLTYDGVTGSRFLRHLSDSPLSRFVGQVVGEAADRVARVVGDGTTTVSLLVWKLYKALMENEMNLNMREVMNGMQAAAADIARVVDKNKKAVKTKGGWQKAWLRGIASVSANNDKALGCLIADACMSVGLTGTVSVKDSISGKEYFERETGYTYPSGVWSDTQLLGHSEQKLQNGLALIVNKKLESIEQLKDILLAWDEYCMSNKTMFQGSTQQGQQVLVRKTPLVIFVSEIEGSAFSSVQLNLTKGTHPVFLVKMAATGEQRGALLNDLNAVLGCHQVFSTMEGRELMRFGKDFEQGQSFKEFGSFSKMVLAKDKVVIYPTGDNEDKMKAHSLKLQEMNVKGDEFMAERIARMDCGIANLYLHASSVLELGDRRERADDAIRAVVSAMRHGVVAGGGRMMQWIWANEANWNKRKQGSVSFEEGYAAVIEVLKEPMKQICENCYYGEAEVKEKMDSLATRTKAWGFNPMSDKVEDFFASGILDPAAMLKEAVMTAASVVGQLLKMENLVEAY